MHNWLILRWRLRPLPYSLKPWVSHRGNQLSEPNVISSRFFEPILSYSTISHLLLHLDIMFTLIKSPSKLRAEHIIYILISSGKNLQARRFDTATLRTAGQLSACQIPCACPIHWNFCMSQTLTCKTHWLHDDKWLTIDQSRTVCSSILLYVSVLVNMRLKWH